MSFTPPKSYVAYGFTKQGGNLERLEIPWKDPAAGEVVLKVLACGVCHSDEIVKYEGFGVKLPRIPGHEIVGEVVAVGPGEKAWKIGQRVGSGWHGGHDHICGACTSGDFIACKNAEINGIWRDGAYAEYVNLRTESLCAVPEDMDPAEVAPLFCAGVTVFNSIRNMGLRAGDVVAVQGIGGLGHLALQFCRAMGYHTVALSSGDSKRELSLQLGAHDYIDGSKEDQAAALTKLGGAKVIACTAPNPEIIPKLISGLAQGGKLLILALAPDATIPLGALVVKRLSIIGWPNGTAQDSADTVAFAKLTGVKTHITKFPLDKAQEAFDHIKDARFRAVIVP